MKFSKRKLLNFLNFKKMINFNFYEQIPADGYLENLLIKVTRMKGKISLILWMKKILIRLFLAENMDVHYC